MCNLNYSFPRVSSLDHSSFELFMFDNEISTYLIIPIIFFTNRFLFINWFLFINLLFIIAIHESYSRVLQFFIYNYIHVLIIV